MKRTLKLLLNFKEESGAATVLVGIFMVVLLGFAAIAIDGGRLYIEKSKLQKALDSAVLAGAQGLQTNEANAIAIAKDISMKNSYEISEVNNLTITGKSIKAVKVVTVPMTFGKVLGIDSASVKAEAKATIVPLTAAHRITPVAIEKSQIPNGRNIKCVKENNSPGNCGFLAVNGNGADNLADRIKNGFYLSVISSNGEIGIEVETEPGQNWGPVKDAFTYLITEDQGKSHCQAPETANSTCRRVIFVPVIDSWDETNGRETVKIIGFAAYWVEEVTNQKEIIGQFIKIVTTGEMLNGDRTLDPGLGDYSLYGVRLAE